MTILKDNVENIYPLTPMQEGMLFHALEEPRSTAYFEQLSWHVRGAVDVPLLERCWNALIRRHATLRTAYVHRNSDRPLQVVLRARPLTVDVRDLRGGGAAAVAAFKDAERARGFDLESEPLLRVAVLTLGDDEHEIVWSHHHIILDGWSVGLLLAELVELHAAGRRGEPLTLAPVPPFSAYVKWLEGRDRGPSLAFWRQALDGLVDPVTLPHTRRNAPAAARRGTHVFDLGVSATAALDALAARLGVTVPAVLHAAWALLLARYNDAADVVFGSVVSGRTPDIPGIERMVGNFINTLPVRARVERGQSFAGLVAQIHADAAKAEPHQAVPLSRIQSLHHAGNALFGTLVSFANFPVDPKLNRGQGADALGFVVDEVTHVEQTHYDIDVQFIPSADLHARITYAQERYAHEQIVAAGGHFRGILGQVLRDEHIAVDAVDLLAGAERERLMGGIAQRRPDPGGETLVTAFERQAAATPDRCAVEAAGVRLGYRELNARANALARRLREACDIAPDDRVALLLVRGTAMVSGILGVLKTGACYVPLEPSLPRERIAFIVRDAGCRAIVVCGETAALAEGLGAPVVGVDAGADEADPPRAASASDLAYVIYTSGSTGVPKGVMIEHAAVLNLVRGLREHVYDRHPSPLRVALVASYGFDASVQQIFPALLHGHTLVVVDEITRRDGAALNRFLVDARIDVTDGTPTLFQALAHASGFEAMRRRVRHALIGGEALPWTLARRLAGGDGVRVSNVYGPTECCVDATAHLVGDGDGFGGVTVPIGRPLPGVYALVLGNTGHLAPVGARGELWIGGAGIARGYVNDESSGKFAECPAAPGVRMYRTADAARWLPGDVLEYLGRLDDQVKVRGYRIELGEVEVQLMQHPAVTHAAAVVHDGELHAAVVLAAPASVEDLRAHLARALPDHMIPARFFRREALPRTSSGKLDRAALAAEGLGVALDVASAYAAPAMPVEQRLAEVWQSVLGVARVGVDDSYFSLGGDSIKAIQILSRMLRDGLRMELADLFRHRTIRNLAPHVVSVDPAAARGVAAAPAGWAPLSGAQARFFAEHTVEPERFHHAVVLDSAMPIDARAVEAALAAVVDHHDALRLVFGRDAAGQMRQRATPRGGAVTLARAGSPAALLGGFDLASGPLWRAGLAGGRVVLVAHHLCIDAVSWSILLEDFAAAYGSALRGEEIVLPPATDAFTTWSSQLAARDLGGQAAFWTHALDGAQPLPGPTGLPRARYRDQQRLDASLSSAETAALLTGANRAYNSTAEDLLLAAFGRAMHRVFGATDVAVLLEHHGRHPADGLDLSRTIGWFTSLYPIVLITAAAREVGYQIKLTKETLRAVPDRGLGYGVLRYVTGSLPQTLPRPGVSFNYLGAIDAPAACAPFRIADEPLDGHVNPDAECLAELEASAMTSGGALRLMLAYDRRRFDAAAVEALIRHWQGELRAAIEHCCRHAAELTPADLSYSALSVDELEDIFQ
jgi:amino acid adenylation domain-containing protein/non-ribosomal peptide synthase protein (TIGR01720 family)